MTYNFRKLLHEPFGVTLICIDDKQMGWTNRKILFQKPFDEWTAVEKFCLYTFLKRDISKEKM